MRKDARGSIATQAVAAATGEQKQPEESTLVKLRRPTKDDKSQIKRRTQRIREKGRSWLDFCEPVRVQWRNGRTNQRTLLWKRVERRERHREASARSRAQETSQEHDARLARLQEVSARSRAQETSEEHNARLARDRVHRGERERAETEEDRTDRLRRHSEFRS